MKLDRKAFFNAVRTAFGPLNQSQVSGFEAILARWEGQSDMTDLRHLAYMLATVWHETDRAMQPIREYGRGAGKAYGTVFYGRGFVQLTWRANYVKAGTKVGKNLVGNPDLALDPAIAADVMFSGMREGWFTGKKLSDYLGLNVDDPKNARRIINGTDKAETIAGYHRKFLSALQASSKPSPVPRASPPARVAVPPPPDIPAPEKPAPAPPKSVWKRLYLKIFG